MITAKIVGVFEAEEVLSLEALTARSALPFAFWVVAQVDGPAVRLIDDTPTDRRALAEHLLQFPERLPQGDNTLGYWIAVRISRRIAVPNDWFAQGLTRDNPDLIISQTVPF